MEESKICHLGKGLHLFILSKNKLNHEVAHGKKFLPMSVCMDCASRIWSILNADVVKHFFDRAYSYKMDGVYVACSAKT